jgi:alkanesulfonate monooxygenase SsuD/methylene tetrahydromethanopterin reductase-like flavin-dependent oxidoreductase (luciferase family)
MKIGIGLPNPVPGAPGPLLVDWARRAEERGFFGLATIDRVAYPNHDSLVTLAAAAGATSRILLISNILVGPVYPPALLAKAAASLDQISAGRFTLGIAPGGRDDDFAAVGRDFHRRGEDFDSQLERIHRIWRGEPRHSPTPTNGEKVPILVGGASEPGLKRVLRWADGWTGGGAPPDQTGQYAKRVRDAWQDAGRTGEPRIAALAYFSLGDEEASRDYLHDYYGFLGDYAGMIADSALRTPEALKGALPAYEDAGVTELYLDPTVAKLEQVDRLADAVL